jgi:hypothetical protein
VAKTWLIIVLVVSLAINGLLIGLILGRPFAPPFPPPPPFPPSPPMAKSESLPRLREYISHSTDSARKHVRQLRRQLVMELASDSTNQARVDSLLDAIGSEQRALQESVIAYLDSLKTVVPKPDRGELHHWIMECFGEDRPMHRGFGRPGHPENPPPPGEGPK